MANGAGLVIPASFNREESAMKNISSVIEKLGVTIDDVMGKDMEAIVELAKEQIDIDEEQFKQEQRQFQASQYKMDQMIHALVTPKPVQKTDLNQPWYVKMVHKSTKYWDKYVVKNKFFQRTLDLLKQGLAGAGNFLMDMLKGLLFLSIFDPNGKLMASIIDIITKGVIFLIDILAKLAPRIIDALLVAVPRIAQALWESFWKISQSIGNAISTIMSGVFQKLQDKFGEGPFFSMMFKLAGILKDPAIAKSLGAIVLGVGILSKLGLLAPLLSGLGKALTFLAPFLGTALSAIGTFITSSLIPFLTLMGMAIAPLLPILLPIIAAITALVAIFIYAEEIVTFFESMFAKFWEWFDKQATWLKVIIGVVMAPIGILIASIYGLAKAFAFFKKEGFINGLKLFFTKILPEFTKKILKVFMGIIEQIIDIHIDMFYTILNFGKSIFNKISSAIKNTFSLKNLYMMISSGIDYVFGRGTFQKISDYIVEAFSVVTDFLQGFIFWLLGKLSGLPGFGNLKQYKGFGEAGLSASIQAAGLVRETGMDISQAGALTQAIVSNDVQAKVLGKQAGLSPDVINKIVQVKGDENQKQEQTAGILRDIRDSLTQKGKVSSERVIRR